MNLQIGAVALLACVFTGCGGSPSATDPTRDAIVRVLRADHAWGEEHKALLSGAKPSQAAILIAEYCQFIDRMDLSDCPAEFRVAFRHHGQAWREVQTAFRQMPDSFVDGVVMGALNTMFRGEMDGGVGRMEGGLNRAMERVRDTWIEVENTGAKYGAAL